MSDEDEVGLCDYCGKEVPLSEGNDCEPDDTGHCILCGLDISGFGTGDKT